MTVAKVYPLNVEADVESLSTSLAELREKVGRTLEEAQTEYAQISTLPATPERKKSRFSRRKAHDPWAEIEERIEDAFEDLDKAIREIRKPFRR
jgi:protein-tyrosine-phosphatase